MIVDPVILPKDDWVYLNTETCLYSPHPLPRADLQVLRHNYTSASDTQTPSRKMKVTAAAALSLAGLAVANPVELTERQSCPKVYVFGARETTAPAGYGTSQGLVNQIKSAFSGAGSEAIVYPACGGQSQCGGVSYDNSATQGTAAVVKAVTAYNQKCPDTQIVLVGYSQVTFHTVEWR